MDTKLPNKNHAFYQMESLTQQKLWLFIIDLKYKSSPPMFFPFFQDRAVWVVDMHPSLVPRAKPQGVQSTQKVHAPFEQHVLKRVEF